MHLTLQRQLQELGIRAADLPDADLWQRFLERISQTYTAADQNRELLDQSQRALRIAKDAAEAASLTKSDFLANMSHEIRTPLNAIIGLTSLLLDSRLEADLASHVETIRASGDSLLGLINDILDFSKIESGQMELEEQPFGVRNCLEGPLDLVSAEAEDKGLTLEYSIGESCPEVVVGDVTRVRQILVNLLSNAIKFTARGKVELVAGCRPVSGEVLELEMAVSDTGTGIPSDKLETIFQSFSQADASTTRKYGGTGLGLAISRRLAELMGGRIWVESRLGRGSTFRFTVRARAAHPDLVPEAVGSRAEKGTIDRDLGRRNPLRILVAEDNVVNQKVTILLLERMGYRADLAADGQEVLDCLDRQSYDVVLMDVQMPGLDGLEATRLIEQRWGAARPRIIAMTAAAMRGDREKCLEVGMNDYVSKPIRIGELQAALERCARNAESGAEPDRYPPDRPERERSPETAQKDLKVRTDLEILGPKMLAEILDQFLDNAVEQEAAIGLAIDRDDAQALARAAHDLKGSSATVGAARMAKLCERIELPALQGSLEEADQRLHELKRELGRVSKFFRRHVISSSAE